MVPIILYGPIWKTYSKDKMKYLFIVLGILIGIIILGYTILRHLRHICGGILDFIFTDLPNHF